MRACETDASARDATDVSASGWDYLASSSTLAASMIRIRPTLPSRRLAPFLTSALIILAAACGGAEPTGTGEPPTTTPDTATTGTVQFASSVDATTRAKVVAFVGVSD